MGYEMKFYVVNKLPTGEDLKYGEIVAMYDYCKDYDLADFIDKNSKPTSAFIFVDGKETTKDMYGKPLAEISVDSLLNYLEAHSCYTYRRYLPFVAMLKGFKEIQENPNTEHFDNLVVLRYGY